MQTVDHDDYRSLEKLEREREDLSVRQEGELQHDLALTVDRNKLAMNEILTGSEPE